MNIGTINNPYEYWNNHNCLVLDFLYLLLCDICIQYIDVKLIKFL